MAPILMYHALKATTPFVDASVNKRLRQFLPIINDCLLQFGDRREASMLVNQMLKCPANSVIHRIQVRTVWWPHTWLSESNIVTLQVTHSVSGSVRPKINKTMTSSVTSSNETMSK